MTVKEGQYLINRSQREQHQKKMGEKIYPQDVLELDYIGFQIERAHYVFRTIDENRLHPQHCEF